MSNYLFLISILFFCKINSIEESEYTMEYYYSLRIGNKMDLNFLLDTSKSNSIFFNDENKLGKKLIDADLSSFTTPIEINTHHIKKLNFDLKKDETKLNNSNIQGIIGLGIKDSSNSLLDKMKEEKLIKSRILYFTTSPYPKIEFQIDIPKNSKETFTGCNITKNSNFKESWNCDLSHIYFEDDDDKNEEKIEINDTIEVNSQVIFDAKSYYITTSIKYLKEILDEFEDENNCKSFIRNDFTYINCDMNSLNDTKKMPFLYFVLGNYAYKIKPDKLFTQSQKGKFTCLIRFSSKSDYDNIWILGYPFFSSYKIKFDYDNNFIGFNGEKPLDFSKIVKDYYSGIFKDKRILFGLIGSCCVIFILILFFIIRSCVKKGKDPNANSKFIEEIQNQIY
jgi:hypothetical protein